MTDAQLFDIVEEFRIGLRPDAKIWDPCGEMGYLAECAHHGFGEPVLSPTARGAIIAALERLKETEHLWNRTGNPWKWTEEQETRTFGAIPNTCVLCGAQIAITGICQNCAEKGGL